MSSKKKCCVPTCFCEVEMHRFPTLKNPARFQMWMSALNNLSLQHLTPKQVYDTKRVCSCHFRPEDYVGRPGLNLPPLLKRDSVPSVNLGRSRPMLTTPEHNYCSTSGPNLPSTLMDHAEGAQQEMESQGLDLEKENIPPSEEISWSEIPPEATSVQNTEKLVPSTSFVENVTFKTPEFKKRRRSSILSSVNATRETQLTPKAKKLYRQVVKDSQKLANMTSRITSFQKRLEMAENVATRFKDIMERVNKQTYTFIMCQVRVQHQRPRARRFTLEEKILALSIFKASGKAYRLLTKIFALPSKNTLVKLLSKAPIEAGVDNALIASLKGSVSKLNDRNRKAILTFDEIYLDLGVEFQSRQDKIIGIQDLGSQGREPKVADYANVFLVKGVYKQWKQPLCYTFTNGPIASSSLKNLIKEVILKCQEAGLEVIATVCDQGSGNVKAIKELILETKAVYLRENVEYRGVGFEINSKEIVPLFDGPHLIKGLRNNLLNKDLHFEMNSVNRVAKWSHIEQLYLLDTEDGNALCNKLTDSHVLKEKISKMKVKCCTQVFSYQVGTLMKKCVSWKNDGVELDDGAIDTAEAILFFDKLFDSINSSSNIAPQGKKLRGAVKTNSPHLEFWREAIKVLKTMKFYCPIKKKIVPVPTISNFILTLKNFIYLCPKLLRDFNKGGYITIRPFQQDALENFFGSIRSYAFRNISPSPNHFSSAFKSLIITNFMSKHSPGSNCEKDFSDGALDNLQNFISGEFVCAQDEVEVPDIKIPKLSGYSSKIARNVQAYISGYLTRKLAKKSKCDICINKLKAREHDLDTEIITALQYPNCKLTKPGTYFNLLIKQCQSLLYQLIPLLCQYANISKILNCILAKELELFFKTISCPHHPEQGNIIRKLIIRCCLFWWCRQVNKIGKGQDERFLLLSRKINKRTYFDQVKISALNKYEARRARNQKKTKK